MVNWSKYNKLIVLIGIIVLSSFKTNKWGFTGHRKINQIAVFALPPELIGFYKTHIDYITDHSVDPDKRRHSVQFEAPRHYIDLEHYCPKFPNGFDSIPKKWKLAILQNSEDSLYSYGIVPWHVVQMKYQLQKAFEEKNYDQILKLSSDIGHYIADAHVPLHTTENYNGQLSNQKGIHGLWESRLVEIHLDNMNLFTGKANYINDIESFIWQVVYDSHNCLDSVFKNEEECTRKIGENNKYTIETKGKTTVKTYSREFTDYYFESLNGMVERRLKQSILAVASIWYTAWVDAGQPKLNFDKKFILDNSDTVDEIKTNSNHKYRNCD